MWWSRIRGRSAPALLLSLLGAAFACSEDPYSTIVEVSMLLPEGQDPLAEVRSLRVRVVSEVVGVEELVNVVERPSSGGWSGLDVGLDLGHVDLNPARVVLEGLNDAGVMVAAGESIPVPVQEGRPGEVTVFFQGLGTSGLAPPLSRPLSDHGAAYVEGGGVILAGGDDDGATDLVSVYAVDRYEPIELSALPSPRSRVALVTIGGSDVLLLGGSQPSGVALRYSPLSDRWSELDEPLPEAFQGSWASPVVAPLPDGGVLALRRRALLRVAPGPPATSAQIGELPVELAGATLTVCSSSLAVAVGDHQELAVVAFDPSSGDELSIAQPPGGGRRGQGAVALADGRLVLAGGLGEAGMLDDVEVYDPSEDSWTVLEGLIAGRERRGAPLVALSDGRRALLVGGETEEGELLGDALVLDLEGESVEVVELSVARRGYSVTALPTGAALIVGGEPEEGGGALSAVEVLRPPPLDG